MGNVQNELLLKDGGGGFSIEVTGVGFTVLYQK